MKKNIFDRILYKLAGKIAQKMREIQLYQDKKGIKWENESWDKFFTNGYSFEHTLLKDLKINLYKDSVLSKLIYYDFEKEETNYVSSVLKKGDIFIDIGANVGLFSLIASKAVGSTGKVISFEPSPSTFKRLDQNIQLNNLSTIDHRNIGLSDKTDELVFFVSKTGYDAWNSFARREDILEDSILVPVSTIDLELKEVDKSKIKLIKIDVEGWEKFVLFGGRDLFMNYNPIVMVEFSEENTFNAGYPVYEIYDIMKDFGYEWHTIKAGELIPAPKKLRYNYENLVAVKPAKD